MKTLLFYDSVVVLNRDTHRDLRLKPQDNLRFAASTNCVPLALVEFGDVAREYPIVFARCRAGWYRWHCWVCAMPRTSI
jgi:hypothetical protein